MAFIVFVIVGGLNSMVNINISVNETVELINEII